MQTTTGRPDRTLVVILSIIAAVVVLALVVVFTRGTPAPLDPATPEGAVQAYTRAVIAGDRDASMALLVSSLRNDCEQVEAGQTRDLRLTLISTRVTGNRAVVRVSIATGYGTGPFGSSSYETDDSFVLLQEDGDWRIDTAPWQLMTCYNAGSDQ
jgi:hypothetical protein